MTMLGFESGTFSMVRCDLAQFYTDESNLLINYYLKYLLFVHLIHYYTQLNLSHREVDFR